MLSKFNSCFVLLLVSVFGSSCTMILPPNLNAYQFKEKHQAFVTGSGSLVSADAGVAYSPFKSFFLNCGIRRELGWGSIAGNFDGYNV